MRTRNHDWFDTKAGRPLYSFQVFHAGKWRHVAEDGKPLLFRKPQERNAKRKEYRARKERDRSALPARDAYDTLNTEVARLRGALGLPKAPALGECSRRCRETDSCDNSCGPTAAPAEGCGHG